MELVLVSACVFNDWKGPYISALPVIPLSFAELDDHKVYVSAVQPSGSGLSQTPASERTSSCTWTPSTNAGFRCPKMSELEYMKRGPQRRTTSMNRPKHHLHRAFCIDAFHFCSSSLSIAASAFIFFSYCSRFSYLHEAGDLSVVRRVKAHSRTQCNTQVSVDLFDPDVAEKWKRRPCA